MSVAAARRRRRPMRWDPDMTNRFGSVSRILAVLTLVLGADLSPIP